MNANKIARAEAVRGLLRKVEEKMAAGELKATLGDYIKLIQLERDLGLEEPEEIRAGWVETEGSTGP